MSLSLPGPPRYQAKHLPIGYWIQPQGDGSIAVTLETVLNRCNLLLNPQYLQILHDYMSACRAAREHNRQVRGWLAGTEPPGSATRGITEYR